VRDFLLDTQTIRYWYDANCQQNAAVVGNVTALRLLAASLEHKPRLLVSVVTLGEIEYGHRYSPTPDTIVQQAYLKFVNSELPDYLEITKDATVAYGELRSRLFNKFAPPEKRKKLKLPEQLTDPATAKELGIQENDLWLCAQAIAHQMVLVTNDRMTRLRDVAADMSLRPLLQDWTIQGSAKIDP
jgi:predicted nucleic acid-binding protein